MAGRGNAALAEGYDGETITIRADDGKYVVAGLPELRPHGFPTFEKAFGFAGVLVRATNARLIIDHGQTVQ